MGFGNFKTDSEVADIFNLTIEERFFIEGLHFDIPEYEMKQIKKWLDDPLSFLSEEAICEDIIKPILRILDTAYEELRVWSHVPYNVDPAKNLAGIPDFLVARPKRVKSIMDVPPLCIIEAKRQNWDEAWAQALAEMYAASTQGATMCYAAVTSGELWQFGKFDKKDSLFIKDRNKIYIIDEPPATDKLQKLFNTLNWVFNEASQVIIEREMLS